MGIDLLSAGVKDIILPGDVKDIINQVLIAEKKAQANVIMRREETASTRSLLNTAKIMDENKTLYRLKELEYIERISEKISSITLSSGGQIIEQLRQAFQATKAEQGKKE
jgi:regulator of protease activity HflC (stomatin/prohibitin superfamily)